MRRFAYAQFLTNFPLDIRPKFSKTSVFTLFVIHLKNVFQFVVHSQQTPRQLEMEEALVFSFDRYELRIQSPQATPLTKATKTPAEIHKKALM